MGRAFTASQRQAISLVCGSGEEADHIVPYSHGGPTAVENGQMISRTLNARKRDFVFTPRLWQQEFAEQWGKRDGGAFLAVVIPGGGKTMAALEQAQKWMAAGPDRRLIVVVPTTNLKEQWRDEASKFGIDLQTKEFGTNFKDGFRGGVATYSLVANQPLVFRKLVAVAPTMVVFDEVHHCGDEAHFGVNIREAFELAAERLLLSGTAWRSDGTPIPWVKYDGNGFAVADYSYDYPHALNDDVVRFLVFDYSRGTITQDGTGNSQTLSSESAEDAASRMLRRLLDPRGQFVREQIRLAHQKLLEVRATQPDAGALAACVDQAHAIAVAQTIRDVTGCEPSLIVSDADIENDTVKGYRNSKREWVVAVRKVSEGTDIKRLQVLCYLTTTVSELFFRQLIGRVSRFRGLDDREAYVFLPADPRLIACAKNIENAQVQALREQAEADQRESQEFDQQLPVESFTTTHGGTEFVMVGGEFVSEEVARQLSTIAEQFSTPMEKVLGILRTGQAIEAVTTKTNQNSQQASKEEVVDHLRKKCSQVAFRLSKRRNVHVGSIHKKFKPQDQMSESELRAKLRQLAEEERRCV